MTDVQHVAPVPSGAMVDMVRTALRGFLMGSADIVPGVSGGTVALVLGIYQRLIGAIREGSVALGRLVRGDVGGGIERLKRVEWSFLLPLLGGIGLAVVALSHLVESLLADHPETTAGLFSGLVAGSVVVAWHLLQRRDPTRIAVLAGAALVTFVLLGLKESTSTAGIEEGTDHSLVAYFLAGAVAICAMILPGVSGSFLLVMLGMYGGVLGAVNERDLLPLAVFGVGAVLGLAVFSQALHWALAHHYDTVMAALIGLMVGSVRVLWPWPSGVDSTALHAPGDPVWGPVLLAMLGFSVVAVFDITARRLEHRSIADEAADLQA